MKNKKGDRRPEPGDRKNYLVVNAIGKEFRPRKSLYRRVPKNAKVKRYILVEVFNTRRFGSEKFRKNKNSVFSVYSVF